MKYDNYLDKEINKVQDKIVIDKEINEEKFQKQYNDIDVSKEEKIELLKDYVDWRK